MTKFELKIPKERDLVGGDLAAQVLASYGVKVAFGLHGGHLDAFLVGCENSGIRLIDTRHETTALQAAEGYAKCTGQTGVCFATANSGFGNAYPGLMTALADRSPIFVVTSSAPLRDAETNALQSYHDQVVLAKPVTKFCHRVTVVEEIPRLIAYAWQVARSGAPGPVLIDFPIDILFSPVRVKGIQWGSVGNNFLAPPCPSTATIEHLLELWKSAARPVIITGTGASRTNAGPDGQSPLLSLAEATETPIFYTSKYSPDVPYDHRLRGGPASVLAQLPAISQPRPDLVILLGARTGFVLGGRSGAIIPPEAKIVQIDIDGSDIGRLLPVELGIVSDASEFVKVTLQAVKQQGDISSKRDLEWVKMTSTLKSNVHLMYGGQPKQGASDETGGRMHPYHAVNTLYDTVKTHHPIVITDGGECNVWAQDLMETAQPLHALTATGYLGFLGNGFGYALGAAVAHPDRLIINLHGDGSAGFHIAELDTYARHKLKILTVVVNNHKWGMSIAGQDLVYGDKEASRPISSLSPVCEFETVAKGFGCIGAKCQKVDEIPALISHQVEEMFAKQGKTSGLVNLIVDTAPVTETTKAMVGLPKENDRQDVIVVPYYDNIPRPFYKDD